MSEPAEGRVDCVQYKPCREMYLKGNFPYDMMEVCSSCFNYTKKEEKLVNCLHFVGQCINNYDCMNCSIMKMENAKLRKGKE